MALNQSLRQRSCRTATGATSGTYEENWLELIDHVGLKDDHAAEGNTTFNGRLKDYLERVMGRRYRSLAETQTAFARFASDDRARTWNELGNFDSSAPVAEVLHDFTLSPYFPSAITFGRTTNAWDYQLRQYASGQPRLVPGGPGELGQGLLMEEQRQNICSNFNVGQNGNTSGVSGFSGTTVDAIPFAQLPDKEMLRASLPGLPENAHAFLVTTDPNQGGGIGGVNVSGSTAAQSIITSLTGWLYPLEGDWRICGTNNQGYNDVSAAPLGQWTRQENPDVDTAAIPMSWRTRNLGNAAAAERCYFIANVLEEGAFATSPIVTSGAAQIRAAETATEAFNRTGVFTVECEALVDTLPANSRHLWSLSDGTSTNFCRVWFKANGLLVFQSTVAGAPVEVAPVGTVTAGEPFTVKAWNDGTNINASLNGGATASALAPNAATSQIGYGLLDVTSAQQLNGFVRRFALWEAVV